MQPRMRDPPPIRAAFVDFEAPVDRSWRAIEAWVSGVSILAIAQYEHFRRPLYKVGCPAARAACCVVTRSS